MSPFYIIIIVLFGFSLLLLMILKFKLNAFISLLITSIVVGILAGMPLSDISVSIQNGMGGTLGFIATVVGLGAIYGQMLDSSGGAKALSQYLIKKFGQKRTSWAFLITGLIVGIPVFFDVAFIIIIPIVYALTRNTKRSILYFAIPLLAGLLAAHALIPPTPGPMAVAEILGVELGWVILFGLIIAIPSAVIAGPLFGHYISKKIYVPAPPEMPEIEADLKNPSRNLPHVGTVIAIIAAPLLLILISTFLKVGMNSGAIGANRIIEIIIFLGHPFTALIITTLIAILLCIKHNMSAQTILDLSTKALGPAGIIILVTGAGGVLKQVLIDSGIGEILAESVAGSSIPLIVLSWSIAALVRTTLGSSTVAMITAAGFIAPLLSMATLTQPEMALVVVAIASGSAILSHVNDSGFWIVSKYLGMTENLTLKSWTVMSTIIAVSGLGFTLFISRIIS